MPDNLQAQRDAALRDLLVTRATESTHAVKGPQRHEHGTDRHLVHPHRLRSGLITSGVLAALVVGTVSVLNIPQHEGDAPAALSSSATSTPAGSVTAGAQSGGKVLSCTARDLSASYGTLTSPFSDPLPVLGAQIAFTNTTTTTCALIGYPTIQLMKADGTKLAAHSSEGSDVQGSDEKGIKRVVVRPGRRAYVQVLWRNPAAFTHAHPAICRATKFTRMQISLATTLATAQRGVVTLRTPVLEMCNPHPWVKQVTNSVFLDYRFTLKPRAHGGGVRYIFSN